jgi:hypothetical protein
MYRLVESQSQFSEAKKKRKTEKNSLDKYSSIKPEKSGWE